MSNAPIKKLTDIELLQLNKHLDDSLKLIQIELNIKNPKYDWEYVRLNERDLLLKIKSTLTLLNAYIEENNKEQILNKTLALCGYTTLLFDKLRTTENY